MDLITLLRARLTAVNERILQYALLNISLRTRALSHSFFLHKYREHYSLFLPITPFHYHNFLSSRVFFGVNKYRYRTIEIVFLFWLWKDEFNLEIFYRTCVWNEKKREEKEGYDIWHFISYLRSIGNSSQTQHRQSYNFNKNDKKQKKTYENWVYIKEKKNNIHKKIIIVIIKHNRERQK